MEINERFGRFGHACETELQLAAFVGAAMAHDSDPAPSAGATGIPGGAETTFELLERVRAGDHQAVEALFGRYVAPLRRWASGRLPRRARDGADTQDLVQETLLQTLKRIEAFEPRREGGFQAYLRQALMNRIRDELRRYSRRGQPEAVDSRIPDVSPSPLERAIGSEATERYEQALGRLRPEDREAIIARIEMGYSYEELAQALGKPTWDAARKAAQRALLRLAVEMKRAVS
jgi:RNA polymerase sigma-70 factor (ECF subfamily)